MLLTKLEPILTCFSLVGRPLCAFLRPVGESGSQAGWRLVAQLRLWRDLLQPYQERRQILGRHVRRLTHAL